MIYRFDTLGSSNDEACKPQYVEGDIILAQCQTAGRGQRGHTWESREGENLTLSLLLEPQFLPPSEQFLISECVALGVCDVLLHYGIEAQIKWTNDIYIGDRKLAGILIEHKLQGSALARTVAGIGLNVNQKAFSDDLPNPISMAQATGREFDREQVLQTVATSLMARYEQLRDGGAVELQTDYHQRLYRLGQEHCYALPDGSRFRGIIRGVEPTG
ncbi:MAG: biotin--[Alistipes sp.]|nr:biotin--[acetyl-CoA-carboxylase] ligase [Alistipes sp.]